MGGERETSRPGMVLVAKEGEASGGDVCLSPFSKEEKTRLPKWASHTELNKQRGRMDGVLVNASE